MLVIGTPDHEAHVTVPGGPSDQKSVHQGDVIGYQQSAALCRHMFGAQHPDAVQKCDQETDCRRTNQRTSSDQRYHRNSVSREARQGSSRHEC